MSTHEHAAMPGVADTSAANNDTGRGADAWERYYARDRHEWRAWLHAHHATATGVWLISYKKTSGQPSVPYAEAVEEALCFGWIDSRANTLDDQRHMQMFTPRKRKSPWSRLNKERVARLTEQGLMMEAGHAAVATAQQNGTWTASDAIEDLRVPDDLAQALATNEAAQRHFAAFSASATKQILRWIASARRAETRANRIAQIVAGAAQNTNPLANTANRKR
ncbi:MAG TPA: YdeI/OmpD-associated family protein [Ktedonobacterales bacterium]|nr:YdeI/OmpD-associated family protein [Ktedonobacterales bacterium]